MGASNYIKSTRKTAANVFDPKKHLRWTLPSKIHKMSDIKLSEDSGVSPMAVSEPFQLFTLEAIRQMRSEIMSKVVLRNCQYSSNLAKKGQLRGYAAE